MFCLLRAAQQNTAVPPFKRCHVSTDFTSNGPKHTRYQSYIPTVKSCPLKQHSSKLAPPFCRQRSFVEIPWLLPYSSQGSTLKKQHQTPQNPHGNKTHPHRHTGKKQQTTENTTTACTVQAFIEQKEVKMAKCKKAKCIF